MRFQEILPRVATRFGQSNAKLSKLAVPANPHCLRRRRICKQRSDSVSLGGLLGVLPEAASFGLARHFNEDDETDDLADWEYVRLVDHGRAPKRRPFRHTRLGGARNDLEPVLHQYESKPIAPTVDRSIHIRGTKPRSCSRSSRSHRARRPGRGTSTGSTRCRRARSPFPPG